jgi:hypothetical protein
MFDLTKLSSERARRARPLRRMFALGLVLLVLTFVLFLASVLSVLLRLGRLDSIQLLVAAVVLVGLAFGAGLCSFALWKSGSGAIGISVDSSGIRFYWKTGRIDSITWGKLNDELALLDYSGNPIVARHASTLWEARRWNRPVTPLSRESFEAILATAPVVGFQSESTNLPNPRWGWAACRRIRMVPAVSASH